jgi:hypothetical protein
MASRVPVASTPVENSPVTARALDEVPTVSVASVLASHAAKRFAATASEHPARRTDPNCECPHACVDAGMISHRTNPGAPDPPKPARRRDCSGSAFSERS